MRPKEATSGRQEYYHAYRTSAQQSTAGEDVEITDKTTGPHT